MKQEPELRCSGIRLRKLAVDVKLLKIYTCQNTVKIIEGIEDVEIHQSDWKIETHGELMDAINHGPGVIRMSGLTPAVESYDVDVSAPQEAADQTLKCNRVKFVDFLKAGEWRRVAIQQYAYLCNDDGKTIAKVGA